MNLLGKGFTTFYLLRSKKKKYLDFKVSTNLKTQEQTSLFLEFKSLLSYSIPFHKDINFIIGRFLSPTIRIVFAGTQNLYCKPRVFKLKRRSKST